MSEELRPWRKIGSKPAGDYRIFSIRTDQVISPRTQQEHEVYVIDCVNWVNVIALTADKHLVMIEQYRHGSASVELEIPGGMMDPGDVSPVAAAARELREETGYEGENARIIGQVLPNPAIMSNKCFTVLVENCRCIHPLQLDHGEDLITRLMPASEVPHLVAQGKIRHSLVLVALYYFDLWQRGLGKGPKDQRTKGLRDQDPGPFSPFGVLVLWSLQVSLTAIPLLLRNRFTSPTVYSPKWKMLAARTASAFPSRRTSAMCSRLPAPPLATTGTPTASLMRRVMTRSKPALVPSASMLLRTISPAPSDTARLAHSTASRPVALRPP